MSSTRSLSPARRPALTLSLTLATALAVSTAAARTVYKTVDESGEVVYSDTPPSGIVGAHRMEVQPTLSDEEMQQAAESRDKLMRAADFEGKYSAKRVPMKEIRVRSRIDIFWSSSLTRSWPACSPLLSRWELTNAFFISAGNTPKRSPFVAALSKLLIKCPIQSQTQSASIL